MKTSGLPRSNFDSPTRPRTQNQHQRSEDRETGSIYRPQTEIKDDAQIAEFMTPSLQSLTPHSCNLVLILNKGYIVSKSPLLMDVSQVFKHGHFLLKAKNFACSNKFSISNG